MYYILYSIIILLGIPTGVIISKMCKEELNFWKIRLITISALSFILSLIIYFSNFEYKIPLIVTLSFVIIMNLTMIKRTK